MKEHWLVSNVLFSDTKVLLSQDRNTIFFTLTDVSVCLSNISAGWRMKWTSTLVAIKGFCAISRICLISSSGSRIFIVPEVISAGRLTVYTFILRQSKNNNIGTTSKKSCCSMICDIYISEQ